VSLSQPQNNGKQDGYPAENALQRGFSAGSFQHIKAIRISDWHFKGVSRQNFFQDLKAHSPAESAYPRHNVPCPWPRKLLRFPRNRYPSMLPLLPHCGAICTLQCNKIGFFTQQSLPYCEAISTILGDNLLHFSCFKDY